MAAAKASTKTAPPKTVDEYMAAVPEQARAALEELRKIIRAAVPEAEEVISYGIPTFKHHGARVYAGAWKSHCGMYGMSSTVLDAHREEIKPYATEKGTLKFPYGKPLPAALVTKLVKAQIAESKAGSAR